MTNTVQVRIRIDSQLKRLRDSVQRMQVYNSAELSVSDMREELVFAEQVCFAISQLAMMHGETK